MRIYLPMCAFFFFPFFPLGVMVHLQYNSPGFRGSADAPWSLKWQIISSASSDNNDTQIRTIITIHKCLTFNASAIDYLLLAMTKNHFIVSHVGMKAKEDESILCDGQFIDFTFPPQGPVCDETSLREPKQSLVVLHPGGCLNLHLQFLSPHSIPLYFSFVLWCPWFALAMFRRHQPWH